jgi:hypothetical protein
MYTCVENEDVNAAVGVDTLLQRRHNSVSVAEINGYAHIGGALEDTGDLLVDV